MLVSLAKVTDLSSTIVTVTALPPDLHDHIRIPLGFVAADASLAARRKSSLQQQTSTPDPAGTASSSSIKVTPRIADQVLAFLNHDFWVCTYTLSETRPGRVKRHFFLPRDWLNLDWLELAVMRTDGVLLCPRNGEVALVENGLREEWLE